jgi:hypothetical protein
LRGSQAEAKVPPQLDLEFQMVGIDGNSLERKPIRGVAVRNLDLCNVPRRDQTTACPTPCDPVLELVCNTKEPGKKKKKASAEVSDRPSR